MAGKQQFLISLLSACFALAFFQVQSNGQAVSSAPADSSKAVRSTESDEFAEQKYANWHQWRGPEANGFARDGNPPLNWSETKNVKWKTKIPGEGTSTPIIWDDQVFVLSAVKTDQKAKPPQQHEENMTVPPEFIFDFTVWCLERKSGDIRWSKVVRSSVPHEGRHKTSTYAGSSAMTNGKHVFASFGSRGIFCLDLEGEVIWEKDLGDMRTRKGWGEAVSPVVHGDDLIIMWDQEDQSKVFVLHASTGEIKWKKERDEPTTWATPLVVSRNGKTQVITPGTTKIRSYDLETGDVIWSSQGLTVNAIPCPVVWKDRVICMSGYRGTRAKAIHLDSTGDVSETKKILWSYDQDTPYVPSPLVMGEHVYFTKSLKAILSCVNCETGEAVFPLMRLPNLKNLYGSPSGAAERVYIPSREGVTIVLKAGTTDVLATNSIDEGIDSSPAIVGNQLFLRSKSHVYCFEDLGVQPGSDQGGNPPSDE